jgi:hypothetical protein
MNQLIGRLQSERLFDVLAEQVTLEDRTHEEAEADLRARREKREAAQAARDQDDDAQTLADSEEPATDAQQEDSEGGAEEQAS